MSEAFRWHVQACCPKTCEIFCRESKAEGSHVKWHTCEGWLVRKGVPAPLKICEHTRKEKMQLWVFCPLYCCKLMSLAGGRWEYGPGNFSGRLRLWRPNGRVLTDLSLSTRQNPIVYVVRCGHCETSNNTAYWNLAHIDGVSGEWWLRRLKAGSLTCTTRCLQSFQTSLES